MAKPNPASSRRTSGKKPTMHENDVIRLVRDLPEHGLTAGTVGTIVHVFNRPRLAYEVEFCDDGGHTTAQLALAPDAIEREALRLPA